MGYILLLINYKSRNHIGYLGYILQRNITKPQKIQIPTDSLKTLNDFQKLLGNINWLRPSLGIPNHSLTHLFQILQGDSDLNNPRVLASAAHILKLER